MLSRLKISNYKSFKQLKLSLQQLNILIGANAAGKSNFTGIFRFLRDLSKEGLENAIYLQGGPHYFRNIYTPQKTPFTIEVELEHLVKLFDLHNRVTLQTQVVVYHLNIDFSSNNDSYSVLSEKLSFKKLQKNSSSTVTAVSGQIVITCKKGHLSVKHSVKPDTGFDPEKLLMFKSLDYSPLRATLLENASILTIYPTLSHLFSTIAVYDFDPKLPKLAIPLAGKKELEENGRNLALILRSLHENPEKQNEFLGFTQVLLPYIERIETVKLGDEQLYLQSVESGKPGKAIPGSFLSDGTINITAIILALYFEKKSLLIIEEPERNIHPYLMAGLIHLIKDASEQKQIIITTHHPEIVKHACLHELLLVSRDSDDFSTISNPSENDEVKTFLKNEVGIEELYIQNLLSLDGD